MRFVMTGNLPPPPFWRVALRGQPPLWRESRVALEAATLLRDPVFRGRGLEDGGGMPVLLVPGFMAGDGSLGLMTQWLRRTGHHTRKAGMWANVGCAGEWTERLEGRLEGLVAGQGRRAAIIGQSRGGSFAKVLARRRPDLVCGIVTLGSPQLDPFAVHPLVRLQVEAVGALGSLGAPGLFSRDCLRGSCCSDFWTDHAESLPRGVGWVSIYSESDGIVDWRACLDPRAEHVEIDASHCGMAVHPDGYRAIATALQGFRRRDARARPSVTLVSRAA
jgi:pimeloyl-ACP methyl ester carboxylesterase